MSLFDDLIRHVHACRDAVLPGGRLPLHIGPAQAGWVMPDLAEELMACGGTRSDAGLEISAEDLSAAMRAMADAGRFRWRDEPFDVRADVSAAWDGAASGPVLFTLDRGALPLLGIAAWGAHLNGLVRKDDGWHLWVAKRAADRPMDPGKLDHVAAGGVPAGLTPEATLVKEAEEEAGILPALCSEARYVTTLSYAMVREEGLRRDRIACFDLILPNAFQPEPHDNEIESFALWPLAAVMDRVRRTDDFKFNVNLVLIDLFLRTGLVQGEDAAKLRAALTPNHYPAAPLD